jgi:Arc/MetJ-type ribon-helix-helix transcriptional regulator
MTVDLSPEDQQKAEALVASGRFASVAEALHAGLSALEWEVQWSADVQASIDEGVVAALRNDFVDDTEVDALFASHQRKSA